MAQVNGYTLRIVVATADGGLVPHPRDLEAEVRRLLVGHRWVPGFSGVTGPAAAELEGASVVVEADVV